MTNRKVNEIQQASCSAGFLQLTLVLPIDCFLVNSVSLYACPSTVSDRAGPSQHDLMLGYVGKVVNS